MITFYTRIWLEEAGQRGAGFDGKDELEEMSRVDIEVRNRRSRNYLI